MAVWSKVKLSNLGHASRIEAEYYRPEYLEMENKLKLASATPMTQFLHYVTDGTHITPKYISNGVPFLSSSDVDPFLLPFIIDKFISDEEHNRLKHCQPSAGDILMSKSGRIGSCAVVPNHIRKGDWNIYEGVALLKMTGIDPHYTVSFLNSKYGNFQIRRELKGVAQPHLHLEDIRRLHVFIPSHSEVSQIRELVIKGTELAKESHQFHINAQHLLETDLGLDNLNFQKPVGYTALFSELEQSRRSDSEFFNPELRYFWKNLSNRFELIAISKVASVLKFSNPTYGISGIPIVTQKHLLSISPAGYGNDLLTTDSWQRSNCGAVLQQNDLLFYSVGAYLGKTNIWLNSDKAVPASFITLLRCHNEKDAGFLQVLLNSRYGILQSKCFQSGTSQQYIYPKDIRKFLIPVVDKKLKKKLQLLVVESYERGLEAKKLLNQAKTRVEQLIEDAVRP